MKVVAEIVVLVWAAWFLLLGVALALAVVYEFLSSTGPAHHPAPTEDFRRIGVEARQVMDRLSEAYLREVEGLFNDHPRR